LRGLKYKKVGCYGVGGVTPISYPLMNCRKSAPLEENYSKYILNSDPVRAFVETALEADKDITTFKFVLVVKPS